jgi:hypothetical protein
MITHKNYHDIISTIDFSKLPEALRKGHEFVKKVTNNGSHWDNYHASETIKKTVDTYFEKLNVFVGKSRKADTTKPQVIHKERVGRKPKETKHAPAPSHKKDTAQPHLVERIPDELRFIRRFVNLDGKTKTKEDLLRFINSLQKAILEKKIRKTSQYAEQIKYIQDRLVETYNSMGAKIALELKPETHEMLKEIADGERVLPSVSFIKRYINLNGKPGMKEKAKLLLGQINRAYEKGNINDSDPYIVEMHEIKKNLENFLSEKAVKVLQIEKNTLNGLQGILGFACQNLNGFDGEDGEGEQGEQPVIMNSMDFANMRFKTLGFKGKWLQLIGDPSANFSVMVFGKPKMGKSYLCVDFAGYLARNHGKVLYIAKEEGLDKTLQDKLNDKDVKHPNLYVASTLPASLSFYDFIFFDSVNRLGLNPEDLNRLKATYPDKSFIYIFQTTKEGKFRGANTFQHDVDSVIEVPEKGKAVQYGRFNQGGEIPIF